MCEGSMKSALYRCTVILIVISVYFYCYQRPSTESLNLKRIFLNRLLLAVCGILRATGWLLETDPEFYLWLSQFLSENPPMGRYGI